MEDLRKRLEYPSRDVRLSAANKLYSDISKISPSSPIDEKLQQIPSLQLLFDTIQGERVEAVNLSCQVIVALVKNRLLDFRFALNKILNFTTTARHCAGLVRSVTDLLCLQALVVETDSLGAAASPYSIRSSPHPFITVYTSKPSLWPVILQELSRCLMITNLSDWQKRWVIMKPSVKYILLIPESSKHCTYQKTSLATVLLSIVKDKKDARRNVILEFFVHECFPCLQLKTILDIHISLSLLESAVSFLLSTESDSHSELLRSLSTHILMVAHRLSDLGEGMLSALTLLRGIADHNAALLSEVTFLTSGCLLLGSQTAKEESVLLELAELTIPRTSKVEMSTIVLPLLQILSTQRSQVTFDTSLFLSNQRAASRVLSKVTAAGMEAEEIEDEGKLPNTKASFSLPQCAYFQCLLQSVRLLHQSETATDWLESTSRILQMHPENCMDVTPGLLMVASALFLESHRTTEGALQVLLDMVRRDYSKATTVLLLFLYKFSSGEKKISPSLTKQLMFAIPELAQHRFSITPILRVIRSMANTPVVSPIAMRLAVNLWKKQERCFPQLQEMMSRTDKTEKGHYTVYDEYLFARAATVRDICVTRPHQHGAELIPTLSKILNDCTKPSEAPAAALAMDALRGLSEAEVVDIRTIWIVLAPKIASDPRPKVQVSICNLLALVPELAVETEEYETFQEGIMTLLWERTLHSDPEVVSAAYSALSYFERDEFYLQDLPENIVSKVKGEVSAPENRTEEGEDEDESDEIPGSCYIDLMVRMLPESASSGFQDLLSSLISQELVTIPRHLNFSATKREERASSQMDKLVSGVPSIINNKYESNRQPALKASIAVAMLLTFEPKMDKSRDKHGKRHLLSQEQLYLNMMRILLNEIPASSLLETSQLVTLPSAWTAFMRRVFQASVEAQKTHSGPTAGEDDNITGESADLTAWLKARDKLCEQLKNVARDNSSANPNCLLALSGLLVVTIQYHLSLGQDSSKLEALSHQRWVNTVVESLLTVLDKTYKASERIFAWCQRGFGHQATCQNTSLVVAVGLSQIAPMLIAVDTGLIQRIMSAIGPLVFKEMLPTEGSNTHSYSMLPGVAMGMLLNKLTEEKYIEVVGDEALTKVVTSLGRLEKAAFSSDNTVHPGALLGLGLALAGMAADSALHIGPQIKSAIAMSRKLLKIGVDKNITVLAQALTLMTTAGYHSNIIAADDAEGIFDEILAVTKEHADVSHSAGVLGHCLCHAGHLAVEDVTIATVTKWRETLSTKTDGDPTQAVCGLLGFISGLGLQTPADSLKQAVEHQIIDSVTLIQQLVLDSQDLRIQSSLISGLAQFYFLQASSSQVRSAVPSSYHYLPEESLIRACTDFLHSAAQAGPDGVSAWQLEIVYAALCGDGTNALPPLNWAILIGPLLRLPFGAQAQYNLMKLMLSQCPISHNASLFLSSWISSSASFSSLERDTKKLLSESLPVLAQHLPVAKLRSFLFTLILPEIKEGSSWVTVSVMRGLLGALTMTEPTQSTMVLLFEFTEKVYDSFAVDRGAEEGDIFKLLASCLIHLPSGVIDVVSHPAQEGNLIKSTLVRSYSVGSDQQSMAWLNACIDVGMNLSLEDTHARLIVCLSRGLLQCTQHSSSKQNSITARMQWLVELMGHCHNVASGKMKLKDGRHVYQATAFLLDLFCCVVGVWSSPQSPAVLGLAPFTQLRRTADEAALIDDTTLGEEHEKTPSRYLDDRAILKRCCDVIPDSIAVLLSTHPWSQISQKVIQWLISMHRQPAESIPANYQQKIEAMAYALCQVCDMKKPVWTAVYSLEHGTDTLIHQPVGD